MANFITTSVTWAGKETLEFFFAPLFIGKNPIEMQGIRVITGVNSIQKLNFVSQTGKLLKAYTKGFSGTATETYTQRNLQVYQFKAEKAQDANEFYQTVFEQVQGKGIDWNNIDKSGVIKEMVMTPFMNGVKSDIFRIFWLGDQNKETLATGGNYSGTADVNYNVVDGILKLMRANSSTTPSASQFFKVAMSHGAVAQVATHTLTGTSGTANIAINGKNYLADFTTSLTGTANKFITDHAAALLTRGIVATSAATAKTIVLTASRAGTPFLTVAAANATGDLAGTLAATTANTAPAALSTDEAIGYFKSLYEGANVNLRNLATNQKVFICDESTYYNLEDTLDTDGTERGRVLLENGTEALKYKGILVLKAEWNQYDGDFATGNPNHIIYTSLDNLVLGLDTTDELMSMEEWYNADEQENRFRTQFKMGVNYVHPQYAAIAF
jgi:hypothetical protein